MDDTGGEALHITFVRIPRMRSIQSLLLALFWFAVPAFAHGQSSNMPPVDVQAQRV